MCARQVGAREGVLTYLHGRHARGAVLLGTRLEARVSDPVAVWQPPTGRRAGRNGRVGDRGGGGAGKSMHTLTQSLKKKDLSPAEASAVAVNSRTAAMRTTMSAGRGAQPRCGGVIISAWGGVVVSEPLAGRWGGGDGVEGERVGAPGQFGLWVCRRTRRVRGQGVRILWVLRPVVGGSCTWFCLGP